MFCRKKLFKSTIFPGLFFILFFWIGNVAQKKYALYRSSNSEFNIINQIYDSAVVSSEKAFEENGGIKDPSMISLGQGPKIRLWDYFGPNFNCISRERVGRIGDGGKWLCGVRTVLAQKPSCVVYSVGSKGEVSFEVGIETKLPRCEIHIFDPTLTAQQKNDMNLFLRKFQFHDFGLGSTNGEMRINNRKILWIQKTKSIFQVQTLSTIMNNLRHKWIDVLKIDIEGGEWSVFEKLFEEMKTIPVTQIQIELHFLGDVKSVLNFFKNIGQRGFRVFSVEPNYYGRTAENAKIMIEYSFIQVDQSGKIMWAANTF